MSGTASHLGAAGRARSDARHGQAQLEPAWRPWLRLLDVVLAAAADPKWDGAAPHPSALAGRESTEAGRGPGTPLLDGAVLRPDNRRLRRLMRELVAAAGEEKNADPLAGLRSRRLDRAGLVEAAIRCDAPAIEEVARTAGVEPDALEVVAQLAAMPLLVACARRLGGEVSPGWDAGYCPVCGAWPALAELRGLERNRRLRCGRCTCDWPIPVLQCPFCGELEHDRLASLLPEGQAELRRLDVCNSCKGYMKTFSTLTPMDLRSLATEDLESVELDLVAQERGYSRPDRPGYSVAVTVERASALPDLLGRWT